jgi:hypothetical protein
MTNPPLSLRGAKATKQSRSPTQRVGECVGEAISFEIATPPLREARNDKTPLPF